jgi:uncharacterized protein (DUF1330 family)
MKLRIWLALCLLTALAVGTLGVEGLHAQAMPPIYVINEITVIDEAGFQTYVAGERPLILKHGGRFLVLGGKITPVIGTPPKRFTLYAFDSMEEMRAWNDDPAQKELRAMRDKVAKFRVFAVRGFVE